MAALKQALHCLSLILFGLFIAVRVSMVVDNSGGLSARLSFFSLRVLLFFYISAKCIDVASIIQDYFGYIYYCVRVEKASLVEGR
jgi:hypothetical protein